ncbi:hypothetical protein [Hymenobacter negativus]|uniref:Leucine-rich repeat domain-containing protein n=1 Tax=Hymenobacter negativus TaxID=2795026 RepID=A0ABS3QPJ7_9BACT|nr:hypothetical protein [Hymenobacter negativus]MBO2013011.1 hypothetical protein [Hymenobacter negativus]
MKEALISTKRAHYMPLGLNQYCIGNKSECNHFEEDGAIILPWGSSPDANLYSKIEALRLLPTAIQVKNSLVPEFIRALPNLLFLELPLPMVLNLQASSLPAQLKTLMVSNKPGYIDNLKAQRTTLQWPPVSLPNLKGLWFFNAFNATELTTLLGISAQALPSLEYLECLNDKHDAIITEIKHLKGLKFLHIGNINNSDTFSNLAGSLESLSIIGTKPKFDLFQISELKKIKYLWINTIKSELNCEVFTMLPELQEINILNSKKIINIESLLKCNALKSVYFLDCNKPFKNVKELFNPEKYDRFNIKYS